MRVAPSALVALLAGTAASTTPVTAQEPSASQPVFRTGVELLAIDLTALDADGRQVTDLQPADLTVEVDGAPRQVVSAEYVRLVDPRRPSMSAAERRQAAEAAAGPSDEPWVSSNAPGAPQGRQILLIVDQGNIAVGRGRQVTEQARRFVDRLQPEDRVGVALIPMPADLLDFTTDHERVKETLFRSVGRATPPRGRFNLSLTEARALHLNSDARLSAEVLLRECATNAWGFEAERCQREVLQDAATIVGEMRQQTDDSVRSLLQLLTALAGVGGSKQVILMSEGLVLDDLGGSLDELATVAADARASIDVLLLDAPQIDVAQSVRPTTPREDRALQVEGLEMLASLARGSFFNVTTNASFAFDRIMRSLEGYYLLAVEAQPDDRDGGRHRIAVRTSRKGVTLRTRRSVLSTMSGRGGRPAEAVSRALRSPLPANDLPMRLSTWAFKEPGSTRHRVMVRAEVERAADQPLEYVTGLALIDRDNRAFVPDVKPQALADAGEPGRAVYVTSLVVDPGSYRLRIAMADSEGRVGSVERKVDVFLVDGSTAAAGDLVLGPLPASRAEAVAPFIEPRVPGEAVVAMTEAYLPAGADRSSVEATLAVRRDERSPVLLSIPMAPAEPRHPDITTLQAIIDTSVLPPGRYLALAAVAYAGKAIGQTARPFSVAPASATSAAASVPAGLADAVMGAFPALDPKALVASAMTKAALDQAAGRGAGAAEAVREAQSGDFAAAALSALVSGDQVVAAFLKGLDLLGQGQVDRAAVQFQTSMSQAPDFVPARVYLGATLAAGGRHREAAGLIQSGATGDAPALIGRLAGEAWLRAGEFDRAVGPLAAAVTRPDTDARAQKALGLAYVMANRPSEGLEVLTAYLAKQTNDPEALLAGVYATYARHAAGAQPSLAADRALAQKWLKAYRAGGGSVPLAAAWVTYLDALK